jgi:predicted MFS family arabinose efflux permease
MWMEVAVVAIIFAVGNILFGHWEAETPRWRRLLKFVLILGLTLAISAFAGRRWAFLFIGLLALPVVIIHAWWLPRHGINGWTGEPRDKYYALRGWKYPPRV